jgi:hypothetical protein
MRIAIEDPGQPDVVRLIEQLDAYQMPLYSPESHHGIAIATLSRPNVVFALARSADGGAVGCGAAVLGEVKGIGKASLAMSWTPLYQFDRPSPATRAR